MNFNLYEAIEILERTPKVIESLLRELSHEWIMANEGTDTWSAYDIVGHLVHGENTDWIERLEIILFIEGDKKFRPFDRFAQFEESKGKTIENLLDEFTELRRRNMGILASKNIQPSDLDRKGIHPVFGEVTLHQLLSTWVAHDLGHIAQICRVMAKRYSNDVGPWKEYLRIVKT